MYKKILFLLLILVLVGCSQTVVEEVEDTTEDIISLDDVRGKIDPCYEEWQEFYEDYDDAFYAKRSTAAIRADIREKFVAVEARIEDSKTCVAELASLSAEAAPSYEGDEKKWLELVSSCYTKKAEGLKEVEKIIPVQVNFLHYSDQSSIMLDKQTEIDNFWQDHNANAVKGENKKTKEILDKLETAYNELKVEIEKADKLLKLNAFDTYISGVDLYLEAIDLRKQAWSTSGSSKDDLFDDAYVKGTEGNKFINNFMSDWPPEEVEWRSNTLDKQEEIIKETNGESNDLCNEAGDVADIIFS